MSKYNRGFLVGILGLLLTFCNTIYGYTPRSDSLTSGLQISVLTCGPGAELYSTYGHTAIRVIDSTRGTDKIYNYGTFNFGDPDFYSKFTRGKLLYYVNEETFEGFMQEYRYDQRVVFEQVLAINPTQSIAIHDFLLNNSKEENKYYKYDFLFDNCSTRIRDLLQETLGKNLVYGKVIADDSITFRTLLNYYERNLHWERFGINLLMSDLVDEKMKNQQSFFLPDYLMQGIASATLNQKPLVAKTLQLIPEKHQFTQPQNQPKMVMWGVLIFFILLSFVPKLKPLLLAFDVLLFMLLGLLGCLMLFMWLGTEHLVCAWNRNLLWAFPLHIVFAYLLARNSKLTQPYAKYTSALLVVAMFYGMVAKQEYISEITPLLILILLRLGMYARTIKLL